MSIPWQSVLTDPLGLCGYALFLVFGIVTYVVKQKTPANRWVVPTGMALAVICVLGGLALAYHREPVPSMPPANTTTPAPSMRMGNVDQNVSNGNAIGGVQGGVTSTSTQQSNTAYQYSEGPGSPNVQGVQGPVTLTIDQSNGRTKHSAASLKKQKR